jgi:hypothetical protein
MTAKSIHGHHSELLSGANRESLRNYGKNRLAGPASGGKTLALISQTVTQFAKKTVFTDS